MPSDDAIIALIKDSFLFSCVKTLLFKEELLRKVKLVLIVKKDMQDKKTHTLNEEGKCD